MKRKEGGFSNPPLHSNPNEGLEIHSSGSGEKPGFNPVEFDGNAHTYDQRIVAAGGRQLERINVKSNFGEFATITSQAGLNSINDSLEATVKKSLTLQTKGELDQSSVVRNFRTTAANGKTYDVAHYNQGPSRHQVSTKWAPSRSTARVTGYAISYLQKYRLTEKGNRLLAQLDKEGAGYE